jgi:protein TonB
MLPRTLIQQSEPDRGVKPRVILMAPKAGHGDLALDDLLLEKTIARRKPTEVLVSVLMHGALLGAILVVPMLIPRQMVFARDAITMLTPPTLPFAPPAPAAAPRATMPKPAFNAPQLTMTAPKLDPAARTVSMSAPDLSASPANDGSPDGVFGGLLGGSGSSGPLPPQIASALHVGGQIQRPELVYNPEPEYPKDARKKKVQGDVKIDAIVDKDGNVVEAHAISGNPLLVDAALKAVSQWKYQPTYLNGSPYPLELVVDVNFHLS